MEGESPSLITSCNCVSGGSGVCILCLFMPFAKVSLVQGLGLLVWVAERWGNVRTNIHERAGHSDSKAAFGFRDKICSNFSFGFQVVRVLRRSDSGVTSVLGNKYITCLLHRNVYQVPNTIFSSFQVTCVAKGVYVLHVQSTLH